MPLPLDQTAQERQFYLTLLGIADDPSLSLADLRDRTGGGAKVESAVRIAGKSVDFFTNLYTTVQTILSRTGKKSVGQDEILVNVCDYGAVADSTGATGNGSDNTTAIRNAIAAAVAKGTGATIYFPGGGSGIGYRTTDTIDIDPRLNVKMDFPIIYDGANTKTAVTWGNSVTRAQERWATFRVRKSQFPAWIGANDYTTDSATYRGAADRGLLLDSPYWCNISIEEVSNFTIGYCLLGSNTRGASYNNIKLGKFVDNRYTEVRMSTSNGWVNENTYFGGEYNVSSNTSQSMDRIGCVVTSDFAYYNNNNVHYKPSYEIKGDGIAGVGLPIFVEYGVLNTWKDCRHESPDLDMVVTANDSYLNTVEIGYNFGTPKIPTFKDNGTSPSSIVKIATEKFASSCLRPIFRSGELIKEAHYYNSPLGYVTVRDMTICTSATAVTELRGINTVSLNGDNVAVAAGACLGVYMSTRACKRFTLVKDTIAGFGGRLIVRAYDSAGNILTTAGSVKGDNPSAFTQSTTYGNAFKSPADLTSNFVSFVVASNVDYVFVGLAGGSTSANIKSFAIYAQENASSATWSAFVDNNRKYVTNVPVRGVWPQAQEVFRDPPAVASPKSWICTVAGGASSATWAATTAYTLGTWIKTSTGKVLECTVAGTSGAVEPAPVNVGDVIVDGGVTWVTRSLTSATFVSTGNL